MSTTTLVEGANSEFQVNEISVDNQSVPVIATSDTGRFLVVWEGPDGDSTGIFARLFDADGSALTSDFQVNTYTEGSQHHAEVIFGGDGNFIITWRSEGQDTDQGGIYARRFDADAAALGDEVLVNALTTGDQFDPDVAARPDGTFVVAWASQAGAGGIHSRRFEADGTPLDVTTRFRSAHFGTPSQNDPVVVRNAAGDFVVVWTETVRDATLDPGIYAQAFFADGTPRSGEILVPQIDGQRSAASRCRDRRSGQLHCHLELDRLHDRWSRRQNIQARQFSANGVALSDAFTVNAVAGHLESAPQIGMDASGNFTIVWQASTPRSRPLGSWHVASTPPAWPLTVASSW